MEMMEEAGLISCQLDWSNGLVKEYDGKDDDGIVMANHQDRGRLLSFSGRSEARHSKAKDVDCLPHL